VTSTGSAIRHLVSRGFWEGLRCLGVPKGQIYRLTGKSKLTPQQRRLLWLMRCDNAASAGPFRASEFWSQLNKTFDDLLEIEGLSGIESLAINRYFSGHSPSRPLEHASWLLYNNLKTRDRLHILDKVPASVDKESGLGYLFEGNFVSWDLLISVDALYAIAEIDDSILTKPVTVLDLGGGWGRIGYVLKSVNPKCVYITCDLPESLFISSSYLPRLLQDTRAFHYIENRKVKTFSRESLLCEGGIRFCGTQDLLRFADKSLDFFINIASFQEMTPEQVDQYFDIIDSKVNGILYIQEYWSGLQMGHTKREISGYQSYPFRPHWKCNYVRNVSFSSTYFEAAFTLR